MTAEAIVFGLMAVAAVAGALTVVLARNPVYSGIGLLGTMLALAVIYVSLLAHFVAVIQIIVYAGAVMTLFLFVLMLIGIDRAEDNTERLTGQRYVVGGVGLVTVGFAVYLGLSGGFSWVPAASGALDPAATSGTAEIIGETLFTDWVLAFEATALLLTISAAGAIALAMYRRESE